MDISKATEIIKLLANGKHPRTKARLDENHVINEPDVIRALNKIVETLSSNDLVIKHQRTRGAIRSRLVRLGKIALADRSSR